MDKVVSPLIKKVQSLMEGGRGSALIRRDPTDLRFYHENGVFNLFPARGVEKAVSDFCQDRFDLVFEVTRNDIRLASPDMAKRIPALWATTPDLGAIPNTEDVFAQIGRTVDKEEGPQLPKPLDEQLYYFLELCEKTRPTTAILFINAEFIFPKNLNNDPVMAHLVKLLQLIQNRDHFVWFIIQDVEAVHPVIRNPRNCAFFDMPSLSSGEYRTTLEDLSVYFSESIPLPVPDEVVRRIEQEKVSCANLYRLCERSAADRKKITDTLDQLQGETETNAKVSEIAPQFNFLSDVKTCFDDVAGLENVKELIRDRVIRPLQKPEIYRSLRINPGGAVLLYGPPGTGKTLLARAIAGELKAPFISIKASDLKIKWVGDSEKAVKQLFQMVKGLGSKIVVVFIDEADAILGTPTEGQDYMQGTRAQFLAEMDGVEKDCGKLLMINATNHPRLLDRALVRPGRLHPTVYIGPPDLAARTKVFELELKGIPGEETIHCKEWAEKLEGYTGADIKGICDAAKYHAAREACKNNKPPLLEPRHLTGAVAGSKPSITQEDLAECEEFQRARDTRVTLGNNDIIGPDNIEANHQKDKYTKKAAETVC